MATWDTSFVRDGRGLADWLRHLVSEDAAARHAAGEALGGMWQAKPRNSTPWADLTLPPGTDRPPDLVAQAGRFAAAAREAVAEPDFPRTDFVRRLILYRLALNRDWLARVRQMKFPTPGDQRFAERLARDNRLAEGAETFTPPGMTSYVVLQALDTALLDAPDLLHTMLDQPNARPDALDALRRLGPDAAPFAKRLLGELDDGAPGPFDGAEILGNVARADAGLTRALVERLRAESHPVAAGAAAALGHVGPEGLPPELAEEAIRLLRGEVHVVERSYHAVAALASLGRAREDVLADLLVLAAPRPPRVCRTAGKYPVEYDEVMHERGTALESLRYFTAFPERVVPVLVDAIESFEEYDPDWGYDRAEHGRVVASLRAFGPAAGELGAPVLARHLRQSDGDPDVEVIRLLGDIGAAARAALPALEAFGVETGPPDPSPDRPNARTFDPVHWAIWRIRSGDAGTAGDGQS